MSVTCEWKYKLGTAKKAYWVDDSYTEEDITFYGGGNCLFVAVYEKTKNLYTFAIDKKHAKSFITNKSLDLWNVRVFIHDDKYVNKQCKDLAKLFVDLGVCFSLVQGE